MAPSYRSMTSATGASTALSATAPAGLQGTDFQLLVVSVNAVETVTTPANWVKIGDVGSRVHVFTSTTATGTQAVTKSGSARFRISRLAYSNHQGAQTGSFVSNTFATSGTGAAFPDVTTTYPDSLVVAGSLWSGGASSATSTPPGGWSERSDLNTGSPDFLGATVADMWSPTATTVTGASFTWSAAAPTRAAWAFVLRAPYPELSGTATGAASATSTVVGKKNAAQATAAPTAAVSGMSGRKGMAATRQTATDATSATERIRPVFTAAGATSSATGAKRISVGRTTTASALSSRTGAHNVGPVSTTHAVNPESLWPYRNHAAGAQHVDTALEASTFIGVYVGGGSTRLPPHWDTGRDLVEYVPTKKKLRFIAQDIATGQIRDWDLPLIDVEVTYTLSGPTVLRGKIGPERPEIREIGLDAWATYIHIEENGVIRASVIVQPLGIDGQLLDVEGVGFTAYPNGIPWMGALSAIQIDAAEVVRRIWQHLQTYPDGNLGVTVDSTNTGRLLGTPARYEYALDAQGYEEYTEVGSDLPTGTNYDANRIVVRETSVPAVVFAWLISGGYTAYGTAPWRNIYPTVTDLIYAKNATGWLENSIHPKLNFIEAKPYVLSWYDDKDCGGEIDALARSAPFDYIEQVKWNEARTGVDRFLAIKYPRAGRKRTDLRFAEDENVLAAIFAQETPDFYASQIVMRGVGSGRDAVRGYSGTRTNRLRRVALVTDKRIVGGSEATFYAHEELLRRMKVNSVSQIVIDAAHPNAPLGAFELGDDILVEADVPYIGRIALYHRVISYTWRPDSDILTISVRRSDQFAYGRTDQETE